MAKVRDYCFTWNNYTPENEEFLAELECKYLVYGHEIAPTTGTPHLQGYVYFNSPRSFNSVRKDFKGASIRTAKAEADPNRVYCIKEGINVVERGTMPKQGKRTDIQRVREAIAEGQGMRQISQEATSYQSLRTAELLLKYQEKSRNWKPKVFWFYGATGTGKTKTAHEMFPEAYFTLNNKWWEGYDAHEVVIIDELRQDCFKVNELLELMDRYEYRVEHKGGSRQMRAKHIIITSSKSPDNLFFGHGENIYQITRRCKNIICIEDIEDAEEIG